MHARTETIRALAHYLEQWLAFQGAHARVPGIQAAVRVGEELVLNTAWGVADTSTGEELTTGHLFRIASHSKTFTATAIMQLVEAGRLRLDDPLGEHIPELADAPIAVVTVREALGHQGGIIRDGRDKGFWQRLTPFPDRAGLLRLATDEALTYQRNEHFKYSNVSYSLLGLVIEAASGSGYADYVREHVIDRLGLAGTGPEFDPARAADFVHGHTALLHGSDQREPITHVDSRAFGPATGFYSTAADVTTYGAAHFLGSDALLTDASKRVMQRLESVIEGPGTPTARYGVGMSLRRLGDRDLAGHAGGYPGQITRTYIDATDQIVVSVLTNAIDGPADALATGIVRLIELALNPPPAPASAPGPEVDLDRYVGRFASLWGVTDVARAGDRLYLLTPSNPDPTEAYLQVTPTGANSLQIESASGFGPVGEQVRYERDDDDQITSVWIGGAQAWPTQAFLARRSDLARGPLPGGA
ncbi:serine hydrolase domain-containing protein [Pseudactinotalea sp. Z1739]|uniref:serine hydrolase domain-containing protein n=1 Tax=Pseudactinotalea sp. Z1739 TaxID=3413028 RepID=UPI003C79C835